MITRRLETTRWHILIKVSSQNQLPTNSEVPSSTSISRITMNRYTCIEITSESCELHSLPMQLHVHLLTAISLVLNKYSQIG